MATYYAWSAIRSGKNTVKVGESVTATKLGISEDEFDHLVDSGAVRDEAVPEVPATFPGSITNWQQLKLKAAGGDTEASDELAKYKPAKPSADK